MSIFFRHLKPSRPPEIIKPPRIEFMGEQAGPVEDELKAKFCEVFTKTPTVMRAYLARVSYSDHVDYSIALCIRSTVGTDHDLQRHLGQVFTDMFRHDEHLDTLFMRDDQEQKLMTVCKPFYEATSSCDPVNQ